MTLRHGLMVAGFLLVPIVTAFGQATNQPVGQTIGRSAEKPSDQPDRSDVRLNGEESDALAGFDGYAWKTSLGEFDGLQPDPVYVRVAYLSGKVTRFDVSCWTGLMDANADGMIDSGGTADNIGGNNAMAISSCREIEGQGYHALAEYYGDSEGFRITTETGGNVVLSPVTYLFCTRWNGFSSRIKGDPLEVMRLCGARLQFRSETLAQAQAISEPTYRTAFEQTLNWLIKTYGPPEDFDRIGKVYLPNGGTEPPQRTPAAIRHKNHYWCRPKGEALIPVCSPSIVLSFDAETGHAEVIFPTAPVWVYAYARQFGGAEGDPLYRVLNGGMRQPKVRHQCMDSFVCKPTPPAAVSKKALEQFRLTRKKSAVE